MWLTKNEKKVLQLLLENSRVSDTDIAKKLNISSQAVGRIRKELEEELIKEYSVKIDSNKLGAEVFVLVKFRFIGESNWKELEKKIIDFGNTIILIRTMQGDNSYVLTMGFKDINEMEKFLNDNNSQSLRSNLIITETMPYCQKNVLKHSAKDFLKMMIDQSGTKKTNFEL